MWVNQENDQDPYKRTNPLAGTPTVGAGGGVASAPAAQAGPAGTASNPSTQTPTPTNQPTQNFGTVQDYLKGNQQQGEALGQQFTGNLATAQTNAKSAIDTAAKQTQSDINAGTTAYDSGLVGKAVSDPTKITGNPDQLNSFLKQWNAAYTGPTSFENSANYAPASGAAAAASNLGQEESTTGGQQQLLHDQFGVYGQGNQGLDQAILQSSSYFPKVQDQAKELGTVQDYLTQQAQPLNTAANTAAANTAAAQTNTRGAFANTMSDFQKQVNAETAAKQSQAQAVASKYQQDLASGDATAIANDLKQAGVSAGDIPTYLAALNKNYGVKPDASVGYNFNPATAITTANTATPEEYAKAAAYGQLTGQDYTGILNPANAAQAGTAAGPNSGFNVNNLQNYLKTTVGQYDKELLSKTSIADTAAKLNLPNILDLKNAGSVANGTQMAQAMIDAAKRSGYTKDPNSGIEQTRHDAAAQLTRFLNSNGNNKNDPNIAGLMTFVRSLDTYLYGKPQY